MGAATIVTLLGVAIIVAAIALYLIIISVTLNHVSYTLGTVIIGVKAIVAQTDPVPKYVGIRPDFIRPLISGISQDLLLLAGRPDRR